MLRLRAALQHLLIQGTAPAVSSGCLTASSSMPARRGSAPCVFFLRGHCRRGDYCAYSHAPAADLHHTLPFADRQFSEVGSATQYIAAALPAQPPPPSPSRPAAAPQARPSSSQTGASGSSSGGGGGGTLVRVMSYNVLADHLAHGHAAELYTYAPQYALEWAYRRELIVRWGPPLPAAEDCLSGPAARWSLA